MSLLDPGFGLGTVLHWTPFQWIKIELPGGPTAQTSLVEAAATSLSPPMPGPGTMLQFAPFQCRIKVVPPAPPAPTAHTSLVDTTATPDRLLVPLLGLGTTRH